MKIRHQRPTALTHFLFGCPYYPEHWTPVDREDDAQRMADAGVNVVRMAEFAWDYIEPSRNTFRFDIFDETIEALGRRGISTMLCTPTATPPRWMTIERPEFLRIDSKDRRMEHGSRQHCCTNSPGFRDESDRITQVMAKQYADNPHVIGWQLDNELHCHFTDCYCPACHAGFRAWLKKRYRDINSLNESWGTQFWAQTYASFDQIPLPYLPERPTHPNPGQLLDYWRFQSDGVIEFIGRQAAVLRATNKEWWITHNGLFGHIDLWKFAEKLDFMGVDIYPGFHPSQPAQAAVWAASLEMCRSSSGNFIVPELQSGAGGQRTYLHETPRPGQQRLWAWQCAAHGADGVLHFRWRTCRFGAEMYWNGILDHDNIPRRRYKEFSQEGAEFKKVGERLLGTVEYVKAAVLVDQEQDEAHGTMHLGLPGPYDQRNQAYRQLWLGQMPAGFVDIRDSFDGLQMLIVPSFIMIDEEFAEKLAAFVQKGGTVAAFARTATRDRRNHVLSVTPPGMLDRLFGITVEEFGKFNKPLLDICIGSKKRIPAPAYETLKPRTASVAARYSRAADGGNHAACNKPAITINYAGKGKAIYIGTYLNNENAGALIDFITSQAGIEPLAQADEGVEATCRYEEKRRLTFVLNHHAIPKKIQGLPSGHDLLSGKECTGTLILEGFGVSVIES
jgi:beta-galactosidase